MLPALSVACRDLWDLLMEDHSPTEPPRQRPPDDPGESRRRLEVKRAGVTEVRSMEPVEPLGLDDEVPEPIDDDSDDGLG
jgi:hypothetical protein